MSKPKGKALEYAEVHAEFGVLSPAHLRAKLSDLRTFCAAVADPAILQKQPEFVQFAKRYLAGLPNVTQRRENLKRGQ